ncbi:MAG: hypothetical protein IK078_06725, partial [Lachnospiraceae bacterium]|nr:hypothetical protein [Lachnospiraceae bacterium]
FTENTFDEEITVNEEVAKKSAIEKLGREDGKKEAVKTAESKQDADPEKETPEDRDERLIVDMIDQDEAPEEKTQTVEDSSQRMSRIEKQFRRIWKEEGFRLRRMDFDQFTGYAGSQVSGYDPLLKKARSIPCRTLAASIPWAYPRIMEDGGRFIGVADQVPVFVDFFKKDEKQVNSNVLIAGRDREITARFAGNLLSEFATADARIFAFDTEKRFRDVTEKLGGAVTDSDDVAKCRINPFQIVLMQSSDEKKEKGRDGVVGDFATHLYFLDGFFKLLLKDVESDALEYLGSLIEKTYHEKGIYADTDLTRLRPEDYPIFDDLYARIQMEFAYEKNEYLRSMLRSLINHISKFAGGGRNGSLWNGPTTCIFDGSFSAFDFSSMMDSGNTTLAAAQFLLFLRMLMGNLTAQESFYEKLKKEEEDKAIENDEMTGTEDGSIEEDRNGDEQDEEDDPFEDLLSIDMPCGFWERPAIVWIGLADEFLSDQDPIVISALWQMARKLQKEGGMLVIDTKNPGAFTGSGEMTAASSALLGEFRYGFFSALSDGDLKSLGRLLELRGGIHPEEEQVLRRLSGDEMAGLVWNGPKFLFHAAYPDEIPVDEDGPDPQEEMIEEYMPETEALFEDMKKRRQREEKEKEYRQQQREKLKKQSAAKPAKPERKQEEQKLRDPDGPNEDKLMATLEQILSGTKTEESSPAPGDAAENSKPLLTISREKPDQPKAETAPQPEKEHTDDGVRDAILQLNETLKAMQQFMSSQSQKDQ